MSNQSLVSVVMNCYNSDKYLKEAIDSVINQTYKNWEIIFWDNQSIDNSAEIIKSYNDERVKYFYASQYTPLGEARNLAIDKCSGEWIGFLDCDDIWHNNKLAFSFNKLNLLNGNVSLIYTKFKVINEFSSELYRSDKCYSNNLHDNLLIMNNFIVFSSILVRRDVLLEEGKISPVLTYCEDYELLLKVSKNREVLCINDYLTCYRMHNLNITSTKIYENSIETIEFLKLYIKNNKLVFLIRLSVLLNNSYTAGILFIKVLKKLEFSQIKYILKNYYKELLLFPFSIVKKIFYKIKQALYVC